VAGLCTGHVAAGAQSDLIWVHRLVIAEVPPNRAERRGCAPAITAPITVRDGLLGAGPAQERLAAAK
jgi:hypothetical protein